MEENTRHRFIGNSILSQEWMTQVKTGGPYLILAEGLFMYLREADVNDLFQRIQKELGTSEIICEVISHTF